MSIENIADFSYSIIRKGFYQILPMFRSSLQKKKLLPALIFMNRNAFMKDGRPFPSEAEVLIGTLVSAINDSNPRIRTFYRETCR